MEDLIQNPSIQEKAQDELISAKDPGRAAQAASPEKLADHGSMRPITLLQQSQDSTESPEGIDHQLETPSSPAERTRLLGTSEPDTPSTMLVQRPPAPPCEGCRPGSRKTHTCSKRRQQRDSGSSMRSLRTRLRLLEDGDATKNFTPTGTFEAHTGFGLPYTCSQYSL